jgi:hypothetical protein
VFHTRCPRFLGDICVNQEPPLAEAEPGHFMRCHIPIEELRAMQAKPGDGAGHPGAMRIRAAVLERTGAEVEVTDVDLARARSARGAGAHGGERASATAT